MDTERALGGFGFSLGAAAFWWLEGAAFLLVANVVTPLAQYGSLDAVVVGLGLWSFLFAGVLTACAFGIYLTDEHQAGLGIVVIVLSVLGLAIGGGFVLGTIFGVVGGALAIRFGVENGAEPLPDWDAPTAPTNYPPPRTTAAIAARSADGSAQCPVCHAELRLSVTAAVVAKPAASTAVPTAGATAKTGSPAAIQ